jgi:hypothetical protein
VTKSDRRSFPLELQSISLSALAATWYDSVPTAQGAQMATVDKAVNNPLNDSFLAADPDTQTQIVLKDYSAAYKMLESGSLEEHRGKFVAFLNSKLVGAGIDQWELRLRVSAEQKVHPERVAIIHIIDEIVL